MKTVNIQVMASFGHPGQDRRLPDAVKYLRLKQQDIIIALLILSRSALVQVVTLVLQVCMVRSCCFNL